MPKMKTHKGILKRVKVTKHGKVMRRKAGGSHLMGGKKQKVVRNLRGDIRVAKADEKNVLRMLGNVKQAR